MARRKRTVKRRTQKRRTLRKRTVPKKKGQRRKQTRRTQKKTKRRMKGGAGESSNNRDDELRANMGGFLEALEDDENPLEHVSPEFLQNFADADREVVLVALAENGNALQYASQKLKADKDIVLAAVEEDGVALQYASQALKVDKEVVLKAVENDGHALQYASQALKADREVVLVALAQNGNALEHASVELKADWGVVLAAVVKDSFALRFASPALRGDSTLIEFSKMPYANRQKIHLYMCKVRLAFAHSLRSPLPDDILGVIGEHLNSPNNKYHMLQGFVQEHSPK